MRISIAFGCALVACSAPSKDDVGQPTGPCASRTGIYKVVYTELSGTCGPVPDQLINLSSPGSPDCVSDLFSTLQQNCRTETDFTCSVPTGEKVRQRGYCQWSQDASSGRCEIQAVGTEADGRPGCSSMYEVRYSKR